MLEDRPAHAGGAGETGSRLRGAHSGRRVGRGLHRDPFPSLPLCPPPARSHCQNLTDPSLAAKSPVLRKCQVTRWYQKRNQKSRVPGVKGQGDISEKLQELPIVPSSLLFILFMKGRHYQGHSHPLANVAASPHKCDIPRQGAEGC